MRATPGRAQNSFTPSWRNRTSTSRLALDLVGLVAQGQAEGVVDDVDARLTRIGVGGAGGRGGSGRCRSVEGEKAGRDRAKYHGRVASRLWGESLEKECHSMYSRSSSSGSLKSSGTTSNPLRLPAFGTPVTGGRGRVEVSRKMRPFSARISTVSPASAARRRRSCDRRSLGAHDPRDCITDFRPPLSASASEEWTFRNRLLHRAKCRAGCARRTTFSLARTYLVRSDPTEAEMPGASRPDRRASRSRRARSAGSR